MLKYKKHHMYLCVKMKFISSWSLLPSHVYRLMYMNFGPIDYLILHCDISFASKKFNKL